MWLRRTPPASAYRSEDGVWLVEMKLRDVRQLFDTLDPSPFHEKDLDADAESYLVSAVRELGPGARFKLVVHLPVEAAQGEDARTLPDALRHYFLYRAEQTRLDLARIRRAGAATLAIGVSFLGVCLWLRSHAENLVPGASGEILAEGLLIMGWVALWRPIDYVLYDWWPVFGSLARFRRIAQAPIEVRSR